MRGERGRTGPSGRDDLIKVVCLYFNKVDEIFVRREIDVKRINDEVKRRRELSF